MGSSDSLPPDQKGIAERVTGGLLYSADLRIPNILHGMFVRLPCARARILKVDSRRASRLPGIVRILTSRDFPGGMPRYGPVVPDQPVLAVDETRFVGDPVALVVAESERAALAGLEAVRVEYEELPAVLTAEQALAAGAPLVQEPHWRPDSRWKDSNIMDCWEHRWGDVESIGRACALVMDNTYRAPFVHHFALETLTAIGLPDGDGVTIITPVQHPFLLQRMLARMLSLPLSRVRVRSTDIGGSFGSKGYAKIEPAAALAALMLRRPVRISLTAEEAFLTAQREAAHIHIRTGFERDGRIVFQDISARFLVGAYTDISPRVISKACYHATVPYLTPAARVVGCGLFTHTPPTTAFRGFGNTHTGMAVEGQMNLAAARLGIDPVEIRLRNLPRRGETLLAGESPVDGDWASLLTRATQTMGWDTPRPANHGRGVAFGLKGSKPATLSRARVVLHNDSSATAYAGTTEMGQGARTVLSRVVSLSLGIPLERVAIQLGDTAIVPFDAITAASRSTVSMGNALQDACAHIRAQLEQIAHEVDREGRVELLLGEGTIRFGGRELPLADLLRARYGEAVGEVTGEGCCQGVRDSSHPLGGPTPFFEAVATAIEVRVEPETGRVIVEKLVHVSDVGRALNAKRAEGVDEGGIVMGLGVALSEQLVFGECGQLVNGSSLDYRIPSALDIPREMRCLFQENQDGPGPLGAKGLGEGGILAIVPAVCGAVFDATGIYVHDLPITPEKLWRALRVKN